ncbi:carbohydrate esterase family 16 protein [Serpula lacrymans var. lacrymans S7.3]|uniref:Carbohydrate esterase family 16 protein n=2 Tax=Serpula lacrymans var. lacrymans TaxID=341189 RepID=F8QED0_SERL3|nr:carbohydrate esterase family 16 protein [Serpula lacrymans var. lacrymans S7.9]EGN93505.1 carbohydrate esterase family 16 protein [Serpula lacrymans var. lacrymans S7.3]EGO18884.1 carbohydrate esterase family 16 protein [Serpula lacrymans var. lacrymans S7.9]
MIFHISLLAFLTHAQAAIISRQVYNDGIHLAVGPQCGPLGGTTADVNAGLNLGQYKTIVSFGDSYTDGGRHDGGPLAPPVIIPPNAQAGGRSTNGRVWIEDIADDIGATLMDYAISSAVTNITLWPSNPKDVDFIMQVNTFLSQSNNLDSDTTLYTVFFGINDWEDSFIDGDHLPQAAHDLLNQMQILSSSPTNARNFLVTDVYGRGTTNADGQAWLQSIFDGLTAFHSATPPLNVAFANFARIWDGVLGSDPGYQAFGYTNTSSCVIGNGTSTVGSCSDPEHYFYWIPGHPSKETHRIMADYVEEVLNQCHVD